MTPVETLPRLPVPPAAPDIPIQPPPAPATTRVDTANPPEALGPSEIVGPPAPPAAANPDPTPPASVPPTPPPPRANVNQLLTTFFTTVSTNAPATTVIAPFGFTPPVTTPAPSSRAVYEKTP